MALIISAAVVLLTSVWISGLTIQTAKRYSLGVDRCDVAHKSHKHWVPRLGAFPVGVALLTGLLLSAWMTESYEKETAFLVLCLLPAFGIGLLEDVLQNLGTLIRLIFTMIGAAMAWWLLDARLLHVDFALVDQLLNWHVLVALLFTVVAAAGVAHAFNIIDGCNGLSSFMGMATLSSLGVVAAAVGDTWVLTISVLGACALLGFFFWNFPMGRLFLGDGGAYVTGLLVAIASIMLVRRNPDVSPWFPMLLISYPAWETLFSAFRRSVIQRWSATRPDRLHMHNLIYGRLVRMGVPDGQPRRRQALRSALTTAYLGLPMLACAVFATAYHGNTLALQLGCLAVIGGYLFAYRALVRFQAPKQLIYRGALSNRAARLS